MMYKPERALTQVAYFLITEKSHDRVEMRYKPERALTLVNLAIIF